CHQLVTAFNDQMAAPEHMARQHADAEAQKEYQREILWTRTKAILMELIHREDRSFKDSYTHSIIQQAFDRDRMYWSFLDKRTPFSEPKADQILPPVGKIWYNSNEKEAHMNEFLASPVAQVILPVRRRRTLPILYVIWTEGNVWPGLPQDAPILETQRFFAIDTLKEADCEKVLEHWTSVTPTPFLYLQQDDALPYHDPWYPILKSGHRKKES
ncbi:MAG: hypothetical protein AAF570_14680, partial [Bacteroidota bacterium]